MRRASLSLAVIAISFLVSLNAHAQITTGTPQFGSFSGGPDTVDLGNSNAHLSIPVLHKKGRGPDFTYDLSYDTSVWYPVGVSGSQSWTPVSNWGWRGQTEAFSGYMTRNFLILRTCRDRNGNIIGQQYEYYNWTYHDTFGIPHKFSGITIFVSGTCGTGEDFTDTSGGYTISTNGGAFSLNDSLGKKISPPLNTIAGSASFTDRNGNMISVNSSGVFIDTLGTTALTVAGSGTPSSPTTFTYTAPSGGSAAYSVKYTAYTVQTKFNCSGISEYGPTSNNLVSEIDLPDIAINPSDKYTFTYEQTPGVPGNVTGRLASVTLPTGGTISYQYSGGGTGVNGITCADGSAATLMRTTPDGAWAYVRALGSGAASTNTITDPQSNNTVVQFQGIYETQRQIYQGAVSPSNLLQTITTCYNGNTSNCPTTAITAAITQRNITTTLSGGLQSEHDDFWNGHSYATETDDYDFGTAPHGPLLKKVTATYANMGAIQGMRQTIITQDGSGNTVSKTVNNYDETSVVATSGTPQHISVSSSRGNLTSVNTYVNATTYLRETTTYFDTGNVQTETDVNGGQATYTYGVCGNSFPTSITEPLSLSRSETWNCTGGVQLTTVDENNQTTTTAYTDAYFWRPASVTDPSGAVTNYCYGLLSTSGACTANTTQFETSLIFNSSNSTVDNLTVFDGLGRAHIQQRRQSPSSATFDSIETDYDSLGRPNRVTLPYAAAAGQTNSTIAATTTTYDPLNRPLTVLDGGGGTTTYFYGNVNAQNNDTLVTRSPNPTGENYKVRQFENDALGRLTSLCEVTAGTAAWPGGNCAQNTSKTGYWTKYTLDPLANLLKVVQNAQAASNLQQTRTFVYDWKSRTTSVTVPEYGANGNGTATYVYDSDATCGTSSGDLVKRADAAGNVICSVYDALHRETARTYPSGPNSSATPQKHFVYDSATVNTQVMAYAKARLAEAYTCTGTCTTKATDIGLSYTKRGELTDTYESTPNSGGYYHTSQSYWANRSPYQLAGLGVPTITYTLDGKARVNTVSASSGQNPVSSTSYNSADLPTAINLGSGTGDSDAFTWDPNTNRMTQYKFTVNSTTLTGNLGWNAIATLRTQNITDGFNSSDTQNCTYAYDDVNRVTSANCGSAANQSFSYDVFGNMNKSGSPYSFNPTYSNTINHISSVGSTNASYDGDGNVLNDTVHAYTWDAEGHPLTIDSGVSLTFDALGRQVEQLRTGSHTQVVYSATGHKLALMNGSTLLKAMVPLSGKAFAIYNSSGLLYYAHPDSLGNIRLATTPTRGMYFDTAYAPFGETYASAGGANLDPAYTGQMDDTGQRQDTVYALYDFPAREYSTQGRWPSPDPMGGSATCNKNPQTQNRYTYVMNNPLSYTDPLGTQPCGEDDPNCGACDSSTDPLCGSGPPIPGALLGNPGSGGEGWPGTIAWPSIPLGLFHSLGGGDTPEGKCWDDWNKCNQKVNDTINELQKKQKEELKTCVKDCFITTVFGAEAYAVCLKVCTLIWVAQAAGDAAAQDLGYRICDARRDKCIEDIPRRVH